MAMQTYIRPFSVGTGTTGTNSFALAVTATSQPITLPTPIGTRSIRVVVVGTQAVFWAYNAAAVIPNSATVPTNGTPVAAGFSETFLLPNDATTLNFIAAGTGSTVYVTIGEGA